MAGEVDLGIKAMLGNQEQCFTLCSPMGGLFRRSFCNWPFCRQVFGKLLFQPENSGEFFAEFGMIGPGRPRGTHSDNV